METEILTTLTGLAAATKASIEAIRAALSKSKVSRETLTLVNDLQARVFELQEIAFRLHEEKVQAFKAKEEALEENARLRADIRQKEERSADRQKYQRKQYGKATVLVCEDKPDRFCCATCFEKDQHVIPLQPHPNHSMRLAGSFYCSQCRTQIHRR